MKILWIDLNSSYAHSSLALPALHAQIMTDPSIEWEIVSATINENTGMIVDEIYRHRPDILAATTWLFNHEQLMHVASRVKALLPEACLVLGGPEFLGDNEEFLRKNPFVDCVFRGEGEEVFPQWLTCWNHPEQWHTVPGLCYLTPNKEYKDNGIARVLNFAGLVPPEQSRFFNWSKPFVQLETTRGCFNTCAFCVSGGEKPVRTLSIESIRERLQLIHAHGIKNVRVLDRTFNYNPRRAKELLRLFLEFHPDIRFHLEIHPALLSEELKEELSLLPKGLLHLEAGIQSLREPVLEKSRRMGKLSDALDGLRFLCTLPNMETHADLIAGLPLYHLHEIFEDVRTLAGYAAGEIQLESTGSFRVQAVVFIAVMQSGDESFEHFDLTLYDESARPKMERVFQVCRTFAQTFRPGTMNLLLQGGTGLGKTYLSACIARVVAGAGYAVAYETAASAFDAFECAKFQRSSADGEAAAQRVEQYLGCDLMILDDLGTEMITAYSTSALYTLINTRLTRAKATIISTNCSNEELQKKYTPQILSRIEGEYQTLPFVGRDIRQIKKEREA